jgi:hypothetical protein
VSAPNEAMTSVAGRRNGARESGVIAVRITGLVASSPCRRSSRARR